MDRSLQIGEILDGEHCEEHYSVSNARLYYYNTATGKSSWTIPEKFMKTPSKIKFIEKPYFVTMSLFLIKHKNVVDPFDVKGKLITRTEQEALMMASQYRSLFITNTHSFAEIATMFGEDVEVPDGGFLEEVVRGKLSHEVETVAFSLSEEVVSEPILGIQGIYIVLRHKDGYRPS